MANEVMMRSVFGPSHKLKVLNPVIKPVMVGMVDNFATPKLSTKVLFHDVSVFKNLHTVDANIPRAMPLVNPPIGSVPVTRHILTSLDNAESLYVVRNAGNSKCLAHSSLCHIPGDVHVNENFKKLIICGYAKAREHLLLPTRTLLAAGLALCRTVPNILTTTYALVSFMTHDIPPLKTVLQDCTNSNLIAQGVA